MSWVRFQLESLRFFIDIILPEAPCPWARPSLQQIRVLGLSTGRKWRPVRRSEIIVTLMYRLSRKSENISLLRQLGSVQACTGIAVLAATLKASFFFKYCLLAISLEDTSVYNLICCLVVVSWNGDHPAMSPQSCRSEVQRLFSLLWRIGCVSIFTSGLGWDSNLLRCLLILSLMTSLT